jgi:hypothetical protein
MTTETLQVQSMTLLCQALKASNLWLARASKAVSDAYLRGALIEQVKANVELIEEIEGDIGPQRDVDAAAGGVTQVAIER